MALGRYREEPLIFADIGNAFPSDEWASADLGKRVEPPSAVITAEREASRESERAWRLAQTIVDTVRDPLVILEGDMTVASVNRAFLGLFLAAELARRIENSLQIITSFVSFEIRRAAEPCVEGYRAM